MFEFLVTSKARRRLLQLLWGRGEEGTASALARSAGIGFASAYRELRAMHALGLVTFERRSADATYRANASHPLAEALRALVGSPKTPADDERAVRLRMQLKGLGAPLQDAAAPVADDDVEETVVRGVALAHHDPHLARALPVCLHRQRHTLRPERLRHHARRLGETRSVGFFLDLTAVLSRDDQFATWAEAFRDRRCRAPFDFFQATSRSRLQRRAAEERTPAVAREWGLRMNMDLDAFRDTFEKFRAV